MIDVRPCSRCISRSKLCSSAAGRFVEIARRLVGEEHGRLTDERARDGHALLLAAGERTRAMLEPMSESDAAQQLLGTRLRLAPGPAGDEERHRDVLDGREFRQQVMELKDESDVTVPEPHARFVVHPIDRTRRRCAPCRHRARPVPR